MISDTRVMQADNKEDFAQWKSDVQADFQELRADFAAQIPNFSARYQEFEIALQGFWDGTVGPTALSDWDLRFHVAYIWERL